MNDVHCKGIVKVEELARITWMLESSEVQHLA